MAKLRPFCINYAAVNYVIQKIITKEKRWENASPVKSEDTAEKQDINPKGKVFV